jgi:hypothetical protein
MVSVCAVTMAMLEIPMEKVGQVFGPYFTLPFSFPRPFYFLHKAATVTIHETRYPSAV